MNTVQIAISKTSYDPFIDFLKGYAILCVVLAHSLPAITWDYNLFYLWGGMQVPLFVIIQTFHAYKKSVRPKFNIVRIWRRILLPFICIQSVLLAFVLILHNNIKAVGDEIIEFLVGGG